MPKRFSMREMTLLTLPVLAIGAVGLWSSNRLPVDDKPRPHFSIAAPTTLEAFGGADAAFVIEIKNFPRQEFEIPFDFKAYLQVKTPHGLETARANESNYLPWTQKLWLGRAINGETNRFKFRSAALPSGEAHFGFSTIAQPLLLPVASSATARLKPLHLSGKWKVDRAQIKPLNLAAWPRKPWVAVRSVTITQRMPGNIRGGIPGSVRGEVVFDLQSAAMDGKTAFEIDFGEHHLVPKNSSTYGINSGVPIGHKEKPRTRVRYFEVRDVLVTSKFHVSGRVSADNRWPLGFQIEPFDFKTAKVGQKLKFKQFPVALPKP